MRYRTPFALLVPLVLFAALSGIAAGSASGDDGQGGGPRPVGTARTSFQPPGAQPFVAPLAGAALAAYPYFDYVATFTEDTPVDVAIDPTEFPRLLGPADLYVVPAKSANAWALDPVLRDVRPGGPQAVSIIGGTIEQNTFRVANAHDLNGDAGTGFGVGYDVVLDTGRDGILNGGDIVDGYAAVAGFYVVRDTTTFGPLTTLTATYSGGTWLGQRTTYPADIASLGQVPLVVISHGNGHSYNWYDYLQRHLASYGCVVMSHQNNTGPGIETASTTTLTNTDYFLGNLGTIAGGALDGYVDSSRIIWIGHSRGGEGVARATDRIFDGQYTPTHFSLDDLILVSSIAPNDYLGPGNSTPHHVNYHLLHGAADGDNGGWPNRESDAPFHVFERAEGQRQVTHVHGADHNDFNCCGFNDFVGPPGTEIGRAEAQRVAKGSYLALVKYYAEGYPAARDFLWRQYETLKPIGVASTTVVDREYVEGPDTSPFVIDDYQTETTPGTSSSGGTVTYDVANLSEGRMDDTDGTFTWSTGDPMNGMARGRTGDTARCVAFDWSVGMQRYLEFEVVPAARDFTTYATLSFRACQGTRHPQTTAELGDLSFTATLRDSAGMTSSIDFAAYGAGIREPYQRTGSGSGAGWQSEFETIRVRLADFLTNGTVLDLTDIVAVRFEFGSAYGSARGRVSLDDVQLTF